MKAARNARIAGSPHPGLVFEDAPLNVYWEATIACGLACAHCRADAIPERDPDELGTEDARALMRSVAELGSMMVITGGDPLERHDLWDLVEYGRSLPISLAITPAVTPKLTREVVFRIKEAGIAAMGLSLDGSSADIHDGFRQVEGTFARSLQALEWAREAALPVQVNTTVTRESAKDLPAMYELLKQYAPPVKRWSLFLLVPTGRGTSLATPSPDEVEELFSWVYETAAEAPFRVGTTEAPHYRRYWIARKQREGLGPEALASQVRRMAMGIRDGNGVVFVSHRGEVYPAGFLPELLGNVRQTPLEDLYRDHPTMKALREPAAFHGRCGACEYGYACGGSRARAFAMTGDSLGEDPLCVHVPAGYEAPDEAPRTKHRPLPIA